MSFTCNQELDLIRAGRSRYDLQARIWEGGNRNRSAKSDDLEMRFRQRELERIIGKGSQTGRQVTEVWKSARSREEGAKRAPFRSFLEIETLRKTLISTVSVVDRDRRQKTELELLLHVILLHTHIRQKPTKTQRKKRNTVCMSDESLPAQNM